MAGTEASTAGTFWRRTTGTGPRQYTCKRPTGRQGLTHGGRGQGHGGKGNNGGDGELHFEGESRNGQEVKDVVVMSAGDEQIISD